jgi:hypothetical protein
VRCWPASDWDAYCKTEQQYLSAEENRLLYVAATRAKDLFISGTIDLVFKEGSGWVIVDFKTDTVSGEKQLASLVSYYDPQLDAYRKAWESVVGEPVYEVGLYFTSINKLLLLKNPTELRAQALALLQGHYLQIGDTTWEIKPQVEVVATRWSDRLEEIIDEECRRIVEKYVEKGIRQSDCIGFDLTNDQGEVIAEAEVAWEQEMVALLRADQQAFGEVFEVAGWKVYKAVSGIVAEVEEARGRSWILTLRGDIQYYPKAFKMVQECAIKSPDIERILRNLNIPHVNGLCFDP